MATADDLIVAFARTDGDLAAARRVARRFADSADDGTVAELLRSEDRGARLVAVVLLVQTARGGRTVDASEEYLAVLRAERLDDEELVDVGAEVLVGERYVTEGTGPLFALAKSDVVWVRRAVLVGALAFVKRGDADTALAIAGRLTRERNPAVQSALGVLLRETGKRASEPALVAFLERNARALGPVALELATQHLAATDAERFAQR